jgi:signal peptidase I
MVSFGEYAGLKARVETHANNGVPSGVNRGTANHGDLPFSNVLNQVQENSRVAISNVNAEINSIPDYLRETPNAAAPNAVGPAQQYPQQVSPQYPQQTQQQTQQYVQPQSSPVSQTLQQQVNPEFDQTVAIPRIPRASAGSMASIPADYNIQQEIAQQSALPSQNAMTTAAQNPLQALAQGQPPQTPAQPQMDQTVAIPRIPREVMQEPQSEPHSGQIVQQPAPIITPAGADATAVIPNIPREVNPHEAPVFTPAQPAAQIPAQTSSQPQFPVQSPVQNGLTPPANAAEDIKSNKISRKEVVDGAKKRSVKLFARDIGLVIVAALILSVILKTFVFQPFMVPSSSMADTLKPNDRILVSKLTPGPFKLRRGDVIVFKDTKNWLSGLDEGDTNTSSGPFSSVLKFLGLAPEDGDEYLVKRLIGLPGDHVSCAGSGSKIKVNGVQIDEPYLRDGMNPSDRAFDVQVPDGMLFVLGDNRSNSADSRLQTSKPGKGFISQQDVVGVTFMRIFPLNRFGWLKDYHHQFDSVS